jgi:hypothetical protein
LKKIGFVAGHDDPFMTHANIPRKQNGIGNFKLVYVLKVGIFNLDTPWWTLSKGIFAQPE